MVDEEMSVTDKKRTTCAKYASYVMVFGVIAFCFISFNNGFTSKSQVIKPFDHINYTHETERRTNCPPEKRLNCPPEKTLNCPTQKTLNCPTEKTLNCPTENTLKCPEKVALPRQLDQPSNDALKNSWRSYWKNNLENQSQLNHELLEDVIKHVFIDWPPKTEKKYFWSGSPKLDGQFGIPVIVDKILGGKRNGFFIEAGALDGQLHSNTLLFEIARNFTGLLIEPSLDYTTLLTRNRKVISINSCLSMDSAPHVMDFLNYGAIGGIKGEVKGWASKAVIDNAKTIKTLCFPFPSILFAIGNPTVDFFSLDVEGVEEDVLKTIPWKKMDIKILSIEVGEESGVFTLGRDNGVAGSHGKRIADMMVAAGYTHVLEYCCGAAKIDHVFVRNDFRSPIFKPDGIPKLMKEVNLDLVNI